MNQLVVIEDGRPLSPDDPKVSVLVRVLDEASPAERSAFQRVTLEKSRDANDLEMAFDVRERMESALIAHAVLQRRPRA